MKHIFILSAAAVFAGTSAFAQDGNNVRVGLGLSSLGGTVEGQYRFNENFAMRGLYAGGLSGDEAGTEVDGDLTADYSASGQLGGTALLLDYYPFGGGLKLSAGAMMSNTNIDLTGTLSATNGSFQFGDLDVNAGTVDVDASVEFARQAAPMLTVGYDWQISNRFSINAELGAIAIGGLDIAMTATPDADAIAAGASQDDINAEIDTEIANIQDDIGSSADLYPYIALMGTFRF